MVVYCISAQTEGDTGYGYNDAYDDDYEDDSGQQVLGNILVGQVLFAQKYTTQVSRF